MKLFVHISLKEKKKMSKHHKLIKICVFSPWNLEHKLHFNIFAAN